MYRNGPSWDDPMRDLLYRAEGEAEFAAIRVCPSVEWSNPPYYIAQTALGIEGVTACVAEEAERRGLELV